MKARPKLSCFWIAVLLWAGFLLFMLPLPAMPWQLYHTDGHSGGGDVGPFIFFLFGVAVLFATKHVLLALRSLWDWLGRNDAEEPGPHQPPPP